MLCFMLGMVLGIPVLIRLSQLRGTRFGVASALLGAALSSLAFTAIPSGGATTAMIAYSLVGLFTGAISSSSTQPWSHSRAWTVLRVDRSAASRVGKECVSTVRFRGSPSPFKKKTK